MVPPWIRRLDPALGYANSVRQVHFRSNGSQVPENLGKFPHRIFACIAHITQTHTPRVSGRQNRYFR